MTPRRPTLATLGALAFGIAALAQAPPMREGRWEITMQMQMPDMPMAMPPMKMTQCITAEDLKDPGRALPKGLPGEAPGEAPPCEIANYKVEGNKVTWKITCKGAEAMSGEGELTSSADAYEGRMRLGVEGKQLTMKLSGKRVGDCTK